MIVKWTPRALREWEKTATYIYREFGAKAVNNFEQDTDKWEKRIASHPEIAHLEPMLHGKKHPYRGLIFSKHNKMIYYIQNDIIWIVAIWDMRREPRTLADSLK